MDPKRRPFVIIDPRGGHGPGIGGFKDDSQVGVALHAGHPVYFVIFFPNPEPGQTLLDVCDAEREFVHRVRELHPDAPKPGIVGNCQAGWAAMMLAAANPDDTGPIVIVGAPMSYWGGAWSEGEGDNPMRYAGGLLGGTWLASLSSDLGAGKFDGAWLVQNFENLNPANTFWNKYYQVFANIDTETERFLEFERWWGGYYLLNREEIEWITRNLFVGNKLWSGTVKAGTRGVFDLREIKVPIVMFQHRRDLRSLLLRDLAGDEDTEVVDVLVHQADNHLPAGLDLLGASIHVGDPVEGLLRRRDVVAHRGELDVEAETPRVDPRELPFVRKALASIDKGGYAEAVARVAFLLAHKDEPLPLSRLQLAHEMIEEYRELLPELAPDEARRIGGEQEIIARYEPDKAVETLPVLLSRAERPGAAAQPARARARRQARATHPAFGRAEGDARAHPPRARLGGAPPARGRGAVAGREEVAMAEGEKPMRIVIENLPKDVSEEEIREALSRWAQVGTIKLIKEGSAPTTLIEVESRELADALVRHINGHFYKGRELAAWVPLWNE